MQLRACQTRTGHMPQVIPLLQVVDQGIAVGTYFNASSRVLAGHPAPMRTCCNHVLGPLCRECKLHIHVLSLSLLVVRTDKQRVQPQMLRFHGEAGKQRVLPSIAQLGNVSA